MSQAFPTIGIIGKRDHPSVGDTVGLLAARLAARQRRVILDTGTVAALDHWDDETAELADLGRVCDLVIVVGGDGTLLEAGRAVAPFKTPLLGINLGRLGFMVDVLPQDMPDTIEQVLAGDYLRDERLLLSATVQHGGGRDAGPYLALNEVVVRNAAFARVLEFDTCIDGDFISGHRADGIIVASPTGSTAYALSGGGPVLQPSMDALVLVPICPHTLSDRPLVIDANHRVEIVISAGNYSEALFTADGQESVVLNPGDRVRVARAPYSLILIHPSSYDYFNILRNKLHWGRGQRGPKL